MMLVVLLLVVGVVRDSDRGSSATTSAAAPVHIKITVGFVAAGHVTAVSTGMGIMMMPVTDIRVVVVLLLVGAQVSLASANIASAPVDGLAHGNRRPSKDGLTAQVTAAKHAAAAAARVKIDAGAARAATAGHAPLAESAQLLVHVMGR